MKMPRILSVPKKYNSLWAIFLLYRKWNHGPEQFLRVKYVRYITLSGTAMVDQSSLFLVQWRYHDSLKGASVQHFSSPCTPRTCVRHVRCQPLHNGQKGNKQLLTLSISMKIFSLPPYCLTYTGWFKSPAPPLEPQRFLQRFRMVIS